MLTVLCTSVPKKLASVVCARGRLLDGRKVRFAIEGNYAAVVQTRLRVTHRPVRVQCEGWQIMLAAFALAAFVGCSTNTHGLHTADVDGAADAVPAVLGTGGQLGTGCRAGTGGQLGTGGRTGGKPGTGGQAPEMGGSSGSDAGGFEAGREVQAMDTDGSEVGREVGAGDGRKAPSDALCAYCYNNGCFYEPCR